MTESFTMREIGAVSGLVRIALAGDLDMAAVPAVRRRADDYFAQVGVAGLVMDLSAVTFLDSVGIGMLIGCLHGADAAGKSFRVTSPRGRVKEVLDLTGVTPILSGESSRPQ